MSSANLSKDVVPHFRRISTADYVARLEEKSSSTGSTTFSQKWAIKALQIPGFDYLMGFVIVANLFVMVIDIDRTASEEEVESDSMHWTEVFGWVALLIFVFELLMRLLALRCAFWHEQTNSFDFMIVFADVTFSVVGLVAGNRFPISILRIFRLAKLARVSKVLRVFPELRLLIAGLISSVHAVFWGTVLLTLCLLVWSMAAVLFIHPLNKTVDYGHCERCPRAYSSVMHATLTFWQQIVTGDSWGQATIPLIEKHPITIFFFIPVFLTVGMAVMNLILGVVVSVVQTAKEELEEEEKTEKALVKLDQQISLLAICHQMDINRSGELSHDEIMAGFEQDGEFRDARVKLNITEEDFEIACSYYIKWMRKTLLEQMQHQQSDPVDLGKGIREIEENENQVLKGEAKVLEEQARILKEERLLMMKADTLADSVASQSHQMDLEISLPTDEEQSLRATVSEIRRLKDKILVDDFMDESERSNWNISEENSSSQPTSNGQKDNGAGCIAETQAWLGKVHCDIKSLQEAECNHFIELKGMLMCLDRKVGIK